jgi:DNA-binding MarR family transcriptional regulator
MKTERFVAVAEQVRLLHHQLVRVAAELHADEEITVAHRAILEFLNREGATPVPAIARARGVTRQHIQVAVDALAAGGHVVLVDNPAHRRSRLVELTESGAATIARMQAREAAVIDDLDIDLTGAQADALVRGLRDIRLALQPLSQGEGS